MTKTYKVIKADGFYVVIDETATMGRKGDWVAETHLNYNTTCQITSDYNLLDQMNGYKDKLIVATFTERLEGVPLIKSEDEVSELAYKALDGEATDGITTKGEGVMFTQGFFQGHKANPIKYSEDDMTAFGQYMIKQYSVFKNNDADFSKRMLAEFQSLQEGRFPVSVELEITGGRYSHDMGGNIWIPEAIKITNKETNTITPVKVNYEL